MRLLAFLPLVLAGLLIISSARAETNVTLASPANGNVSEVTTQYVNYTFNCSASDSVQLASIDLWINSTGTWSQNQTQNVTGVWNFSEFNLTLGPGYYVWNCLAADNSSNYTFSPANWTIQVNNVTDSDPPNISLIFPADGNASATSGAINYTFNCSASDSVQLASIDLWINSTGTWSQNQTQNVTGVWNFSEFNLTLGPGYYVWNCRAGDNSSNHNFSSQNRTIQVSSDAAAPDLWFAPPTPGNLSNSSSSWVYLNVSSDESLSWCSLDWYNGSWTNVSMTANGSRCYTNVTSLASGSYYFRVWANDTAGNLNKTEDRQVNVDTIFPAINITSPLNGTNHSSVNLTLSFTYTESSPHTCWYQYNFTNTTLGNCTGENFTALDHQQSSLWVWMNDTAGNLNCSESIFNVCTESWSCSGWSACSGGAQSRTCTDSYSCGTFVNRPALSQSCSEAPVGGGGGGAAESPDVSNTWASILPGAPVSMSIRKAGLGFSEIRLEVASIQSSVRITVARLDGRPAGVSEVSGKAYQYVNVIAENLNPNALRTSSISFNVSRSWISSNQIDKQKVYLNRYMPSTEGVSGHLQSAFGWFRLQTSYLGEDNENARYSAVTPGFSYFAITGEAIQSAPANRTPGSECGNNLCEPGENASCSQDCQPAEEEKRCRPGMMRCMEGLLEVCNEAGDSWIALQSCSSGSSAIAAPALAIPDWGWVIIVSAGSVAAGSSVLLRKRSRDPFRF